MFLFQSAPDLSVQTRWGHISASPLHPVSVFRPLQPQVEGGALPSQPNHGHSVDQSTTNRFPESRTPTPSDNGPSFTVAADTSAAAFPNELGLVDSLRSKAGSSGPSTVQSLSPSTNAETTKPHTIDSGKQHQKTHLPKKNLPNQQGSNAGFYYQRGHMSQKNSTGNETSHRRMGFHGRGGVDRSFHASKMKQIYVAKQTTTGNSST